MSKLSAIVRSEVYGRPPARASFATTVGRQRAPRCRRTSPRGTRHRHRGACPIQLERPAGSPRRRQRPRSRAQSVGPGSTMTTDVEPARPPGRATCGDDDDVCAVTTRRPFAGLLRPWQPPTAVDSPAYRSDEQARAGAVAQRHRAPITRACDQSCYPGPGGDDRRDVRRVVQLIGAWIEATPLRAPVRRSCRRYVPLHQRPGGGTAVADVGRWRRCGSSCLPPAPRPHGGATPYSLLFTCSSEHVHRVAEPDARVAAPRTVEPVVVVTRRCPMSAVCPSLWPSSTSSRG